MSPGSNFFYPPKNVNKPHAFISLPTKGVHHPPRRPAATVGGVPRKETGGRSHPVFIPRQTGHRRSGGCRRPAVQLQPLGGFGAGCPRARIELGVDLEQHRQLADAEGLAGTYFSDAEIRELAALPESLKAAGFYNCWTRKEAFVKAIGLGWRFRSTVFPSLWRRAGPQPC